jgi:hypothetical protein
VPVRIDSAYQFHYKRFLFENFPKGTGFPVLQALATNDLPLAERFPSTTQPPPRSTTPCRSQSLGTGIITLGIHIAAPGLAVQPAARSTRSVAPGVHRLHAGLQAHHAARRAGSALHAAGRPQHPALSLYVTMDEATLITPPPRGSSRCPLPPLPTCWTARSQSVFFEAVRRHTARRGLGHERRFCTGWHAT